MRTASSASGEKPGVFQTIRPSVSQLAAAVVFLACRLAFTQTPAPPASTPSASGTESSAASATVEISPAAPVSAAATPPALHDASPASKSMVIGHGAFALQTVGGEIRPDQLKALLEGKTLYLRGGYQDNNLEFDEHGQLVSRSARGSFTLSQIQITSVKLSKRKLELEGGRYALHFTGTAPDADLTAETDRVKITPRKKPVRISFDREEVKEPKETKKQKKKDHKSAAHQIAAPAQSADAVEAEPTQETLDTSTQQSNSDHTSVLPANLAPSDSKRNHHSKDEKVTVVSSQAEASQQLLAALDRAFSNGIDDRMIEAMPDFWKRYYLATEGKKSYRPSDPGVLRQSAVDQKAKLISAIDPPSNGFAQANAVAGVGLYHAVVGSDGKVNEVVVGTPIGFGLDEGAEQTIRKAVFQPAMKAGKAVPVALDLIVSFRIYSQRTSQPAPEQATGKKPDEKILPGPYTVQAKAQTPPEDKPAPQADQAPRASADQAQPQTDQQPANPSSQSPAAQPQPDQAQPKPQQIQR